MPILRKNRTIPELFEYLTEVFGPEHPERFVMERKVNGKYEGITYAQFKEETGSFALGLAALGIKKDDKIAIIAENRPEWVYSDMAILGLGAVDVPLYPSLTADSVEFILNNSEAKGVIVSNKFQLNKVLKVKSRLRYINFIIIMNDKDMPSDVESLYSFKDIQDMGQVFRNHHHEYLGSQRNKVDENDTCTIIYTSGTTGEPKGVMLSHKNILSNVITALSVVEIGTEDIFLSFLPLCHIFERMSGYYAALSAGAEIFYADSIETVPQNIIEVKPTIVTTVPRLFERIYSKIMKTVEGETPTKRKIFYGAVEAGKKYYREKKGGKVTLTTGIKMQIADKLVFRKLRENFGGRLRFFVSGGASLAVELAEFFEAAGILILEGYGLTESSPVIAINLPGEYKFGTVGKPFPGTNIKFAADGEIMIRGSYVMQGYYKNKKETDEVIKNGWLYTGDIGLLDEDGYLKITDRKKHLFKTSAGKYIAPAHVENTFLTNKYFDQFVLIGDKRTFLTALIVPDFDRLKDYAASNNTAYNSIEELIRKKEINKLFEDEIAKMQKGLANYERVRKFTILSKPFTIESGEITPSLKIKRKVVEEKFRDIIEEMYNGA